MPATTLASLPGSGLFAWGLERTGAVAVHRVGREEPVAELATVLDIGGRRLALCGDAGEPVVVAGAWQRHGVIGYALDGSVTWQRKDLKRPQVLSPALGGRLVAVHCEGRPLHVLDVRTGETVAALRDVQDYADHPGTGTAVGGRFGRAVGIDTQAWRVTWRTVLGHGEWPGWRRCASSPTHAVVDAHDPTRPAADAPRVPPPQHGGYLWCLDVADGSLAWRTEAPDGWSVQPVAWDDERRRWLVLEEDFDRRRTRIAEHDDAGRRLGAEEVDAEATRTWRMGHVDLVASHGDVLALG